MSKRIFFGQNDVRYFYSRYKDSKYYSFSIFSLVIFVCSILLMGVVIPQLNKYFSIRQEVSVKQEQLRIMNENINFINKIDRSSLNRQLEIATIALPAEKDFDGILNAISDSSIRAGVTFSDFNFSVGDISSKSANEADNSQAVSDPAAGAAGDWDTNSPSIKLIVSIRGDINRVKLFLKEISEKLPLSEIQSIDSDDTNTEVEIKFYYKSYPEIKFQESTPLAPIALEKTQLIERLALWKSYIKENTIPPIGTNSATPLFD